MTPLICTIRIQLPWFVRFQGDVAVETSLRRLASTNDPFSLDDETDIATYNFYPNLLQPLTSLHTVVFALPSRTTSMVWPWRTLEGMIRGLTFDGKDVHLEGDINCISATSPMPPASEGLMTSWTVYNISDGFPAMLTFARILRRVEVGLKTLTIHWNGRIGESTSLHFPIIRF
jgi:hypothetical protein